MSVLLVPLARTVYSPGGVAPVPFLAESVRVVSHVPDVGVQLIEEKEAAAPVGSGVVGSMSKSTRPAVPAPLFVAVMMLDPDRPCSAVMSRFLERV